MVEQALLLALWQENVPFELQVSAPAREEEWSLRQKHDGRRVPLGFWTKTLPDPAVQYIRPLNELFACYLAILATGVG